MDTEMTILIVDDDPHIREAIAYELKLSGFESRQARDGEEALESIQASAPAVVILDIMLPGMSGLDVCRRIREQSDVPIIFLSSRDEETDKVVGLELGGDDYVTKPFSPKELVARVRAILRRPRQEAAPRTQGEKKRFEHGRLVLDEKLFSTVWDGGEVELTAIEFRLLTALMRHPGWVVTRDELMNAARGPSVTISDRTIDSHIRNVRRKLAAAGGQQVIETRPGVGYKLGDC